MVDAFLPIENGDSRPLRVLFLDINAYFASVEQQEQPYLRGKPIAVAPVDTDSTCAIAASYEAKRFGIKTGTNIGEARRLCPELVVVPARPPLYVHYHQRIIETAETVLPVDKVCSIDEMRFRLIGAEREPGMARELATRMKRRICAELGECITCSVGVAPNSFLAKLATEMQKPDGLVILQKDDLPGRLLDLKLTDFTGINRKMKARLNGAAIFTVADLLAQDRAGLKKAFGSVIGERWWYLLRGFEMELAETAQKSLGHSHVLAPEMRTDQGCRDVLLRLISKATARLRSNQLCAESFSVYVSGFDKSWGTQRRIDATNDTLRVNDEFAKMWADRDFARPRTVGITFSSLKPFDAVTPSLFDSPQDHLKLNAALDELNQKFGKNSVFLGAIHRSRDAADEKIAFNKVELFSEGKGDNEWVDTFRGHPPKAKQKRPRRA